MVFVAQQEGPLVRAAVESGELADVQIERQSAIRRFCSANDKIIAPMLVPLLARSHPMESTSESTFSRVSNINSGPFDGMGNRGAAICISSELEQIVIAHRVVRCF